MLFISVTRINIFTVACRFEISYILEIKKYTFVSIEIDEKESM